MPAFKVDIVIEQGADFYKKITWKTLSGDYVDLTGCVATMMGRITKNSTTTLFSLTSVVVEPPVLDRGIFITPALGQIEVFMLASVTDDLDFYSGVYDLEVVFPAPGSQAVRLMEGNVYLSTEVTHA